MTDYCTSVRIDDHIRLDLFTPGMFRVRQSQIQPDPFPDRYEIPFAVGHTENWDAVACTVDRRTDSTMVQIRTLALAIYCRLDTASFIVEDLCGRRLYPEAAPQFGMFVNHCIVFDSASFHQEPTHCSRYSHWFYNPETGLYDINLGQDLLLETFFIWSATYQGAYQLFNCLVGAEPLLPYKGYGYYQTQHLAAQGSQTLLLETARQLRKRQIPCDTLIVDYEWGDGATDQQERPWGSRLNWSSEYTHPLSPAELLKELRALHYDVILIHHSIPDYADRADEDWVCATYPARQWWEHLHQLLDQGVAGTWQDTRQADITNARIYTGMQQYLGRRPLMLNNYDLYRDSCWTKDCVMTPVKQRIGCRRTPFYWTGDMAAQTWQDLSFQIRGITNEQGALKGVSYITNDCMRPGGRELAVRSAQFLCFNSVLRSHNQKPWESACSAQGLAQRMAIDQAGAPEPGAAALLDPAELLGLKTPDAEQEALLRRFIQLRYRYMPYIYTTARETYDSGLPLTRPLMLSFETDPNCSLNQYPLQYMFGPAFLVCPVCSDAATQTIYLPAGSDWIDFWTGASLTGGQTVTVPLGELSRLPLYVRSGAIIPLRQDCLYLEPESDWLGLQIWGRGSATYRLYEDDGVSLAYQQSGFAFTTINSEVTAEELYLKIWPRQGSFEGAGRTRQLQLSWPGITDPVRLLTPQGRETGLCCSYQPELTVSLTVPCHEAVELRFRCHQSELS
ncbi:DUF5110 domain-containing protein [Oscillospiraceae bacterium HV4-5-C5C]|nr:DUF5110 domain-containing protein [Oscillospiraceae bacterium HV4-5-C5C]